MLIHGMSDEPAMQNQASRPSSAVTSLVLFVGVRLYREGLAVELSRDARIAVVGTSGHETEALAVIARTAPDVVLVDIRAPNSFPLLVALREQPVRRAAALAFAVDENDDDIERCAEAGVAGFVTQDASIDDIANAVVAARSGEVTCSPRSAAILLRRLHALASRATTTRAPTDVLAHLTAREREILALLVSGRSNKAIASELHIETTTVKNHVHRILEKVGARTRLEAAARMRALTPLR